MLCRHGSILARRVLCTRRTRRIPAVCKLHLLEWASTCTTRNLYRETRAALARIKCFGVYPRGPASQGQVRERFRGRVRRCAHPRACGRPHRIGTNGSATAKLDLALPAGGGSPGVCDDLAERAKAGGEDFRSDANPGEPGIIDRQQRKSGADRAVRDAGATGYVCGEGARERRTTG